MIGNACAQKGAHYDGTFFRPVDIESVSLELEDLGLHRYGYDRLYSGITGEFIEAEIFIGPTFYQRLMKFVKDTVYSTTHGPTDAITYQPLDGKATGGGLRVGEMERDVLCSHGVARFLAEKFYDHADGYIEYLCKCGRPAIVNHHENIYVCKHCGDNADIEAIPTSWASKLLMQELRSMNIGVLRKTKPYSYTTYE